LNMARTPNETKPRPMVAAWENEHEARDGCASARASMSLECRPLRCGDSAGESCRRLEFGTQRARCIDTLVDQLLALLQVLNCDVDLIVRTKTA
jgi:hypothetical protein